MAGEWVEIAGGRRIEDNGSGGAHIKDYIRAKQDLRQPRQTW